MRCFALSTSWIAGVAVLGCAVGTASAAVFDISRDSSYYITFPSGLSSATTQANVTLTLPAGGSDGNKTLLFKSGWQGLYVNTTGTVSTTIVSTLPPGTTSESGNILNGGGGGLFKFGYSTANGPDFTSSWTVSTVANGYHVLAFGGVGSGSQGFGGGGLDLLDNGGTFSVEVYLQGKWNPGFSTGDFYVTNLEPGYTFTDLGYNGTYTVLSAVTTNYNGTNPILGINLVGAPVPEPSTWSMMLIAAAVAGFATCRRSKKPGVVVPAA